jgi:hypothetical protein
MFRFFDPLVYTFATLLLACSTPVTASEPTNISPAGYALTSDAEQIAALCGAIDELNGILKMDACFVEPDDSRWTAPQLEAGAVVTEFILRCRGEK